MFATFACCVARSDCFESRLDASRIWRTVAILRGVLFRIPRTFARLSALDWSPSDSDARPYGLAPISTADALPQPDCDSNPPNFPMAFAITSPFSIWEVTFNALYPLDTARL
jgi:hypothetical protein